MAQVLYSTGKLHTTIYLYEGKCKVCNKTVKIKSIEPQDKTCAQCFYHVSYNPKD